MSGKELLTLAAKAAGFRVHEYCELSGGDPYLWVSDQAGGSFTWSSIADDGDALRLAVKLELLVDMHGLHVRVSMPYEIGHLAVEAKVDNPAAATRRAITRAAAAIWLAQEGKTP
jgi:hypothetical protein